MLRPDVLPQKEPSSPLMRLPAEIRQLVYTFYIRGQFESTRPGRPVVIPDWRTECPCAPRQAAHVHVHAPRIRLSLCCASRFFRDEVLPVWYASQAFRFACCCDLSEWSFSCPNSTFHPTSSPQIPHRLERGRCRGPSLCV